MNNKKYLIPGRLNKHWMFLRMRWYELMAFTISIFLGLWLFLIYRSSLPFILPGVVLIFRGRFDGESNAQDALVLRMKYLSRERHYSLKECMR